MFARFDQYGLVLNFGKTRLFVAAGVFLGFWINLEGITADPKKVAAIRDRPMPRTTTEIRAFIHSAGYLQSFTHNTLRSQLR